MEMADEHKHNPEQGEEFDVGSLDIRFDEVLELMSGAVIPLAQLDPYNRMIVDLFMEGPPRGSDPWLN